MTLVHVETSDKFLLFLWKVQLFQARKSLKASALAKVYNSETNDSNLIMLNKSLRQGGHR